MSYPDTIDSIPQPSATSPTNNPSASGVSTAQTNAILALEDKVGIGASTPVAGDIFASTSNGTSVWETPSTAISGLTTSNLSSTAGILGSQLSSTAGILGSQLSSTAGILGSQLSSTAGIDYGQLLSTIFSGQIQTYSNTGTWGDTVNWINLGGIKIAWIYLMNQGTTGTLSVDMTPVGFVNDPIITIGGTVAGTGNLAGGNTNTTAEIEISTTGYYSFFAWGT